MIIERSKTGRFVGLFLLSSILFSYPVLTLFNINEFVFGIPLFYLYLFISWLTVIVLTMLCTKVNERARFRDSAPTKDPD